MTVIEIVSFSTGEVVHEVDITGYSETNADKCERGMNRNLNLEEYYTRKTEKPEKVINKSDFYDPAQKMGAV